MPAPDGRRWRVDFATPPGTDRNNFLVIESSATTASASQSASRT